MSDYVSAELEIVAFDAEDTITTSCTNYSPNLDENEWA